MDLLHIIVGISLILLGVSGTIYFLSTRPYQSPESVAQSYDQWTKDGILEFYWGEHIHLGYYGSPPQKYPQQPTEDCDQYRRGYGGDWRNAVWMSQSIAVNVAETSQRAPFMQYVWYRP